MSTTSCPRCSGQVTLPVGVSNDAQVRCPLCGAHYCLADALVNMPPLLEVVDAANEPVSADWPDAGPADDLELAVAGGETPEAELLDFDESDASDAAGEIAVGGDDEEDQLEFSAPEAGDDEVAIQEEDTEIEELSFSTFDSLPSEEPKQDAPTGSADEDDVLDLGEPAVGSELPADAEMAEGEEVELEFGGEEISFEASEAETIQFDEAEPAAAGEELDFGDSQRTVGGDDATIEFEGDDGISFDAETSPAEPPAEVSALGEFGDVQIDASGEAEDIPLDVPDEGAAVPVAAAVDEAAQDTDKKSKKKRKKKDKAAKAAGKPRSLVSTLARVAVPALIAVPVVLYVAMWISPGYDIAGLGTILPKSLVPAGYNKYKNTADASYSKSPPLSDMIAGLAASQAKDAEPAETDASGEAPADAPADTPPTEPAAAAPPSLGADIAPSEPEGDATAPAAETPRTDAPPAETSDDPFAAPAETSDDPFAAPADVAETAPAEGADAAAADDPFGAPETPPAEGADDDPFGSPETPEPASDPFAADETAEEMPAAAADTPPSDDPFAQPPSPDSAPALPDAPAGEPDMPADEADPFGEPASDDAPAPSDDDPFAPAAAEESRPTENSLPAPSALGDTEPLPVPDEPASEALGPRNVTPVSPAQVMQALNETGTAGELMKAAEGGGDEAEIRKARANFYVNLFNMADAITLGQLGPTGAQLSPQLQAMEPMIRQRLTEDPKLLDSLKVFGARWFSFPKRTNNGVVLAGTVESVDHVGQLYQATIKPSQDAEALVIVSAQDPQLAAGDELLTLGSIVEEPAVQLAGYEGSEPAVVWSGMTLKIAPASE